jgi:hypothetical protein
MSARNTGGAVSRDSEDRQVRPSWLVVRGGTVLWSPDEVFFDETPRHDVLYMLTHLLSLDGIP